MPNVDDLDLLLSRYDQLFADFQAGAINEAQAVTAVDELTVRDADGVLWGVTPHRILWSESEGAARVCPADPQTFVSSAAPVALSDTPSGQIAPAPVAEGPHPPQMPAWGAPAPSVSEAGELVIFEAPHVDEPETSPESVPVGASATPSGFDTDGFPASPPLPFHGMGAGEDAPHPAHAEEATPPGPIYAAPTSFDNATDPYAGGYIASESNPSPYGPRSYEVAYGDSLGAGGQKLGFMPSVKLGLSRWKDFSGTSSRSEFWWWMLAEAGAGLLLVVIATALMASGAGGVASLFGLVATLILLVAALPVTLRRTTDVGLPRWMAPAFMFGPYLLNGVALLVFPPLAGLTMIAFLLPPMVFGWCLVPSRR